MNNNLNKEITRGIKFYSFNLYYMKGNDMILSDFLSRQKHDDSNLHKIIPISFKMQNLLHTRYNNIKEREKGK